jgi:hypothetical protein
MAGQATQFRRAEIGRTSPRAPVELSTAHRLQTADTIRDDTAGFTANVVQLSRPGGIAVCADAMGLTHC